MGWSQLQIYQSDFQSLKEIGYQSTYNCQLAFISPSRKVDYLDANRRIQFL